MSFNEEDDYEASKIHLVNSEGEEKVWQNGQLVSATSSDTNAYGIVTVTATAIDKVSADSGSTWVAVSILTADAKKSLAGVYTYAVEGTGRSHVVAKGNTPAATAHAYLTDLTGDNKATFIITVNASGEFVSATLVKGAYTVDGSAHEFESATSNNDGTAGTGTVSVTLNANFVSVAQ